MAKLPRYLFPSDYMADPSANVFNGKLYIYPPMTVRQVMPSTTMAVTSR